MTATTDAQPTPATATPPNNNGMIEERLTKLLQLISRHRNAPGYFERLDEQLAEVRQQIQEQDNRALDEWEGK